MTLKWPFSNLNAYTQLFYHLAPFKTRSQLLSGSHWILSWTFPFSVFVPLCTSIINFCLLPALSCGDLSWFAFWEITRTKGVGYNLGFQPCETLKGEANLTSPDTWFTKIVRFFVFFSVVKCIVIYYAGIVNEDTPVAVSHLVLGTFNLGINAIA